jgi:hypothetical protein
MMGDELRPGTEHRTPTGIFEHWCEHESCKAWGSFGYSRTKLETHWFCYEHREEGERLIGRQ